MNTLNELEKDFVGSLKVLLTRYNIEIVKGFSGFDDEGNVIEWLFSNKAEERKDEVYLTMNEIYEEIQ
jgi:hypothetical protein